jgi:formylglycine-generating enzyme required for sulfatase activity
MGEDGGMVQVAAGPFLRGSPEGVGLPDERPQRELYLSAFHIDVVPVTFGEFERFVKALGYQRPELWSEDGWAAREREGWTRPRFAGDPEWAHVTGPRQPVCGISFWEAEAYARFVGKGLPTEAQWEKAARGTDGRLYPWGNEWLEGYCSVRGGTLRAAPPVGSFPRGASPYGALEMAGGVWEWCADCYDASFYAKASARDPFGPAGELKVARGGAWNALPLQNRTANRNAWKPSARFSNLGFRCVR